MWKGGIAYSLISKHVKTEFTGGIDTYFINSLFFMFLYN